jgi:hypothetical protein
MEGHDIIIEPLFHSTVLYLFYISSPVTKSVISALYQFTSDQISYHISNHISYQISYHISSPVTKSVTKSFTILVTKSVTISATKCMVEPCSSSNEGSALRNVVTRLGAGAFPSFYIR